MHSNVDINPPEGTLLLHVYFLDQSDSDIRYKFQRLEKGSQTSQNEPLNRACKVFDNRENVAKKETEIDKRIEENAM